MKKPGMYDVEDFQYAFGAIDRLDYDVDAAAGLVFRVSCTWLGKEPADGERRPLK